MDLSYCRVCLRKSRDAIALDAVTLEAFNACTQLRAYLNDGFPNLLCLLCKADLKISLKFLERAKDTDKKLREALSRGKSFADIQPYIKEEDNDIFAEIKPEFITCAKDPLEDSDAEINIGSSDNEKLDIKENQSDEDDRNAMDFDGDDLNDADYKASDSEDEDNKPLKEIKKDSKKKKPAAFEDSDSSDSSNDEFDDFFATSYIDDIVNDAPNTPENAIFPKGRYMCKVCKKTYFTEPGLKSHITIHLPKPRRKKNKNDLGESKKPEDDKKANKSQVEKDVLDTDGQNGDDGDGLALGKKKKRRAWACHVCGKNMISASKLRYHMVMHTGEKDFLCTQCPKAYSTIYALQHHMRTHTGERPYECPHCNDKFTRPTTLKSHMRRHTGERPYGCDICGKRFIQHSSMTTHMKLNHMEKKIECPQCDKKYARQSDLNMHLVSHTGDKPYACNFCPSRFIRQANLNKHINVHHSQTEEEKNSPPASVASTSTLTSGYTQQQIVHHQPQPTPQPLQPQAPQPQHMNLDLHQMQHMQQPQEMHHQHIPQPINIVNVSQVQVEQQQQQQGLLTNLLGNAIDPDRGRSMDDILRWGWPSNS